MILHVTSFADWERQSKAPSYAPEAFADEGFIHCCTQDQLQDVLQRYFKGRSGLVLLHIDESKLESELRYESSPQGEMYPHIFGPINKASVAQVGKI